MSEILERHRDELLVSDQLPSFDPPRRTEHRRLLNRLLTPQRLRANEDFMWQTADHLMDRFLDEGKCEFIDAYAVPPPELLRLALRPGWSRMAVLHTRQ